MAFHSAPWPMPASVRAGWTTRASGVSSAPYDGFNVAQHVGDVPSSVELNRAQLAGQLQSAPNISWLNQTHTTHVSLAESASCSVPTDASVTSRFGQACCVMTADCLPVFFWTKKGDQVAIAHAGWRGLANGILVNTLQHFSEPSEVVCGLGPCIGPTKFEVGRDVQQAFEHWPNSASCFASAGVINKFYADLPALAEHHLRQLGVAQVYQSNLCTVSNPNEFFSFRRDGVTGRMANLIWLID